MVHTRRARNWLLPAGVTLLLVAAPAAADCLTPMISPTAWFLHHYTTTDGTGSYLNATAPTSEADQMAGCPACVGRGNASGTGPGALRVYSIDPVPIPETFYKTSYGQGSAIVWLTGPNNESGPAPDTQVTVNVYGNATKIASGSYTLTASTDTPSKITVTLAPSVDRIERGARVSWEVLIADAGCGCYQPGAVPIGVSAAHPWSFKVPFGPIPPPTITLRADPPSVLAEPGGQGYTSINISNTGHYCQYEVNVTAAGDLPVTFPEGSSYVVYEQQFKALTLIVDVPPDARIGSNLSFHLAATAGGPALYSIVPLGQVNYTVLVRSAAGNETTTTPPSKHSSTPALEAPTVSLALLAVVAVRRRR